MKQFAFILTLIGFYTASFAQVQLEVAEEERTMNLGLNNACVVLLENASKKEVTKTWGKFMKRYGKKTKKVKKTKEYLTNDATIGGMSNNTIDVYATFVQLGDDVEMSVWYDLGGAYLSSITHEDRFASADNMLNDFGNQIARQGVQRNLGDQEKRLKGLNGDLKSLRKNKDKLENDIVKYEKKIEEAKNKIAQNIKDQEAKSEEIKMQEGVVDGVKEALKKFN